jgi:hypothetical protein
MAVRLFFLLGVMAAVSSGAGSSVVINELLASNTRTSADPQGQYDDWIELYNAGDTAVDVGGMYLTDDVTEPRKWQIPTGDAVLTTIPAKGFLLIWADGDTQDPGLHADFSLSASGEEVALFDTDGVTLIDHLTFGRQTLNVSYGRYPDGGDDLVVMVVPTPRTSNIYFSVGVVGEPQFSHERGFYEGPFMLELTSETEGATIYYTLDGRDPLQESARFLVGKPYDGPIEITRTTCVRAAAVKDTWVSSPVVTASYIFLEDVIRQPALPEGFPSSWGSRTADYAMDQRVVQNPAYRDEIIDDLKSIPSVCISLSNDDFFGPQGIYANPTASGDLWERAASMEWIDPDTGGHFGVNAGLRIHGGPYGRSGNIKNAFRFIFRTQYGPARLEYPLFPDTDVTSFNMIILRSIWNYSWTGHSEPTARADYLRDVFARDTVRDMGRLTPHGRPVNVYINGLYWGLYIMTERVDERFVAEHVGGDEDDYDVLEAPSGSGGSTTMQIVAGGQDAQQGWNTLFALADADMVSSEGYQAVQAYLDVPGMIDYMLMIYYVGSRDAPVFLGDSRTPRNFYAYRPQNPRGPWVFLPWDVEWSLEDPYVNRVNVVGVWNPHYLMDRLSANADFRVLLSDRIYRHFYHDGVLTREQTTKRYTDRAVEIYGAIVGESARWGDEPRPSQPYTRVEWEAEVNRLVTQYFSGRTQTVLNQLKSRGWYLSFDPPGFAVNNQSQQGGHVAAGATLLLSAGPGAIWYTLDGSDPRVWGAAVKPDSQLTLAHELAFKRVFVPTGPVSDAWRGGEDFDDSGWTGGSGGVGYERSTGYERYFNIDVQSQMYGRNATCYIRIPFNLSSEDVLGAGVPMLKARYDDGFIAYLNGVEILRVQFNGNPTWNSSASATHSDVDAINFETFDISSHVSALRLGQNILAIQGLNESAGSSDFLISVELVATKGGGGTPSGVSPTAQRYTSPVALTGSAQVKARVLNGSAWSALNEATFAVGPVAEALRISELMYHPLDTGHPDDPNAEYIELTNIGVATIDLNLVKFTRGVDFTFPSVDLAPGAHVLVVADMAAFGARYGVGLPVAGQYSGRLNNAGERIELQDAAGQVIHDFRYRDGWYDLTDGLGFSLTVKAPAATDPTAYGDKGVWRPSAAAGGSPGYDDSDRITALGTVVINELMAAGGVDWIELYNTTDQAVDIGGWFLSDSAGNLTKYEIAAGTILAPGGYVVFYEDRHFGNAQDPGCLAPFALSRHGETVYLHSGVDGVLTGCSEQETFDASEPGISFGRYAKSTGTYNFVALREPTPGQANAGPQVGPVVINEIMYHPLASADAEYVELLNISGSSVVLYDAIEGAPWRFTDDPDDPAIELLFPSDPPVTLAPGECLVLVKDLAAFGSAYAVPAGTQVFAWGDGRLSNGGDKIQLSKPGVADADGAQTWVRVDRVVYSDGSHPADFPEGIDPWPTQADGQGASLTRRVPGAYGNDPANWQAANPSPGRISP